MKIAEARQKYLAKHGFKANPLKAVLFDMDGVLFDSMKAHSHCWQDIAHQFNLNISPTDIYMNEGRTAASTINFFAERDWRRKATEEEIKHIYNIKCKAFNEFNYSPPMEGALSLLQQIKKEGLKILCVTGSGQASLLEKLQSNYPDFFEPSCIVSSKDCTKGKPYPDPYLLGLERGNISCEEAIVVENAPLGVTSAVNAKIFTIAVNTGPLADEVLWNAGADFLYPSMQELSNHWSTLYQHFQ